jgi:hypothetical protein
MARALMFTSNYNVKVDEKTALSKRRGSVEEEDDEEDGAAARRPRIDCNILNPNVTKRNIRRTAPQ